MERHPIEGLMDSSLRSIREMADVNTVLGDAIETKDGSTVLPVSRVSFGFVAGGGEYGGKADREGYPFAGGAGAGVSIRPVGFLVCGDSQVRMLPAQSENSVDRVIDLLPGVLEELKRLLTEKNGRCGKKKEGPLPEVPAE